MSKDSAIFDNVVAWLSLKEEESNKNNLLWVNTAATTYDVYDEDLAAVNAEELQEFMEENISGDADDNDNEDNEKDDDDRDDAN